MRQKAYDPSKQYLVACHPHGFIGENICNLLARGCPEFNTTGIMAALPGLGPVSCCVAPAVSWYHLFMPEAYSQRRRPRMLPRALRRPDTCSPCLRAFPGQITFAIRFKRLV